MKPPTSIITVYLKILINHLQSSLYINIDQYHYYPLLLFNIIILYYSLLWLLLLLNYYYHDMFMDFTLTGSITLDYQRVG